MLKEALKNTFKPHSGFYRRASRLYRLGKALKDVVFLRRGSWNYLLCYTSSLLALERSLGKPILLSIEPVNTCNLKCPVCETGAGILGRPRRMMSAEEFRTILSRFGHDLRMVFLYFMGETFLNRESYQMIRIAADRGLRVSVCTNGEVVDPARLVESGLAEVQFQVGGATPETHAVYRAGGNLDKTLEKIREVVRLKRSHGGDRARHPFALKVSMGLIVMKHNEHEIEDFRKLARNLGVDHIDIVSPCVRTSEQARDLLPSDGQYRIYDSAALKKNVLRLKHPPDNHCEWIYSTMTVLVNGDVVPCCRDTAGEKVLGNLLEQGVEDIWNSSAYRRLRKDISLNQKGIALCRLCEGYGMPNG